MFLAKIGTRVMNACLTRALSRTFPRFLILMITPSVRTYSLRLYSFSYVNLLSPLELMPSHDALRSPEIHITQQGVDHKGHTLYPQRNSCAFGHTIPWSTGLHSYVG